MQRAVGLFALGALVAAAYLAVAGGGLRGSASQPAAAAKPALGLQAAHADAIPGDEVIVGHPRDGIVALPAVTHHHRLH